MGVRVPISKAIIYDSPFIIRIGNPCTGIVVDKESDEVRYVDSKIRRVKFVILEINRLRDLLGSKFSVKAPKKVFDEECKKLFDYECELENHDKNMFVTVCETES